MEIGGGRGGAFKLFFQNGYFSFLFFFLLKQETLKCKSKKQKIFYNIKKSSVVGGRPVTEILSTFAQHGLRRVHGRTASSTHEGDKTVPGDV